MKISHTEIAGKKLGSMTLRENKIMSRINVYAYVVDAKHITMRFAIKGNPFWSSESQLFRNGVEKAGWRWFLEQGNVAFYRDLKISEATEEKITDNFNMFGGDFKASDNIKQTLNKFVTEIIIPESRLRFMKIGNKMWYGYGE